MPPENLVGASAESLCTSCVRGPIRSGLKVLSGVRGSWRSDRECV